MEMTLPQKLRIAGYCLSRAVTGPTYSGYDPHKVDTLYADPYPVFDRIRSDKRIFFCPKQAAWVVGGDLQTVNSLMHDPRLSIRFPEWKFAPHKPYEKMSPLEQLNANLLMSMPREDHGRLRRLASPAFNPRQVENLSSDIQHIIDSELDKIDGVFNVVEFVTNIPLYTIAEYIGVPKNYLPEFSELADSVNSNYDPTIDVDKTLALQGLDMLKRLMSEKKAVAQQMIDDYEAIENPDESLDEYIASHSKEFLTSLMVKIIKSDEGQRITEPEALSLIASTLAAGIDTTVSHLTWAIIGILKNPEVIPEILADDSFQTLDHAVIEAFRWDNFGHSGAVRFATEDIEIYGQKIKKGEMVRPMKCAVLRDPDLFPNPETFDIHRENLKEVGVFGAGPHFCLGAAIAKKITRLTLWAFLTRFPGARVVSEPKFKEHFISRYITELMVDPSAAD